MAVRGTIACVGGRVMELLDVSDPSTPRKLSEIPEITYPISIGLFEKAAYAFGQQTNIAIADITDPTHPRVIRNIELTNSGTPVIGKSWFAIGTLGQSNMAPLRIQIWDAGQPSNPALASSIDLLDPVGGLHGFHTVLTSWEDRLLVANGPNVDLYSLEDLRSPRRISRTTMASTVQGARIQDDLVYLWFLSDAVELYRLNFAGQLTYQSGMVGVLSPDHHSTSGPLGQHGMGLLLRSPTCSIVRVQPSPGAPIQLIESPGYWVTVDRGSRVELRCQATSPGSVHYQWYRNSIPIPEQTQPTLEIADAERGDAGFYHVVASSTGGSVRNLGVNLGVNVPIRLLSPIRRADGTFEIPFAGEDGLPAVGINPFVTLEFTSDVASGRWAPAWNSSLREEVGRAWFDLDSSRLVPILQPPGRPQVALPNQFLFRVRGVLRVGP